MTDMYFIFGTVTMVQTFEWSIMNWTFEPILVKNKDWYVVIFMCNWYKSPFSFISEKSTYNLYPAIYDYFNCFSNYLTVSSSKILPRFSHHTLHLRWNCFILNVLYDWQCIKNASEVMTHILVDRWLSWPYVLTDLNFEHQWRLARKLWAVKCIDLTWDFSYFCCLVSNTIRIKFIFLHLNNVEDEELWFVPRLQLPQTLCWRNQDTNVSNCFQGSVTQKSVTQYFYYN